MDPVDLAERLCAAAPRRSAGSDAERRAARLLALELRRAGRRDTRIQTLWVRPSWAAAQAFLVAVAIAGSVLAVDRPGLGVGLIGGALLAFLGDLSGRLPLLRWVTHERATQLVVARDPRRDAKVRVVLAAPIDAPRAGVLDAGRLARALPRRLPVGRFGLVLVALLGLLASAALRAAGMDEGWLGAAQLVPTVLALVLLALLADAATARPPARGTGAAAAAAVVVALAAELAARPPRALAVDVVLHGAGGAHALGFRRWLRAERRRPEDVAVVAVEACAAGGVRVWTREGLVLPLQAHPQLVAHARDAGLPTTASPSTSAARAARARRWPALRIGTVGPAAGDDAFDAEAVASTLDAAREVVRRLDAALAPPPPRPGSRHARRAARLGVDV